MIRDDRKCSGLLFVQGEELDGVCDQLPVDRIARNIVALQIGLVDDLDFVRSLIRVLTKLLLCTSTSQPLDRKSVV